MFWLRLGFVWCGAICMWKLGLRFWMCILLFVRLVLEKVCIEEIEAINPNTVIFFGLHFFSGHFFDNAFCATHF